MAHDSYVWWNNSAIGAGAQQASPATDRQKLEKALAFYDDRPAWPAADNLTPVLDAARKHLETLPKPGWRVTGHLPNFSGHAAEYVATSRDAALDFARDYLKQGMRLVTVTEVKP